MLRRICFGFLLACLSMTAQVREKETAETREEKIRDVLEKFNLAYQQKDIDTLSKLVSPDLTAFVGGKAFNSWEDYRDNFLSPAFARALPPSTWETEKIVTSSGMAWAYTKTHFTLHRQQQEVQADLYQVFVFQRTAAQTGAKSTGEGDWKIALIDNTYHREMPNPQLRPDNPQGSPPK